MLFRSRSTITVGNKIAVSVFCTVLINFISLTVVLPTFAPMLLSENSLFSFALYSSQTKLRILSILFALYPLGQFLGSNVFGFLSDHMGRRKTLLVAVFGSFVSFLICTASVLIGNLLLLILGRFFAGLMSGTMPICYSTIADSSPDNVNQKAANFSLVTLAIGMGWILGPILGGFSKTFALFFNLDIFAIPFIISLALSGLNFILVVLFFKETLHVKTGVKFDLLRGFKNIVSAFKIKNLRYLFLAWFFYMFAWGTWMQFLSPYMVSVFSFQQSELSKVYSVYGICYALAQIFLVRRISLAVAPIKTLRIVIAFLIFNLLIFSALKKVLFCLISIGVSGLLIAQVMPNLLALISSNASRENQGQILGFNQSLQSLAWFSAPLIVGSIVAGQANYFIFISSIFLFFNWVVLSSFYFFQRRKV